MFNTHEYIKPSGNLNITITNEFGIVTKEFSVNNLVVTAGKNWITGRLKNTSAPHTISDEMSHMAIGTETTTIAADPVALGDTTLGTELVRTTLTPTGGEVANNDITFTATFSPSETYTGTITEAGIFNANSGGTMLCRTKFLAVNKAAADIMTVVWTITAS